MPAVAGNRLRRRLDGGTPFQRLLPAAQPLLFLSHIAAACPGLGLGTAVMVLPWYDPVRFAEDWRCCQLSDGELHIGMGRGTAKIEYDAFGIGMETARDRFRETWQFTQQAPAGRPHLAGHTPASTDRRSCARAGDRPAEFLRRHRQRGERRDHGRSRAAAALPVDFPRHAAAADPGDLEDPHRRRRPAHRGDHPHLGQMLRRRNRCGGREQALEYLPEFFALQVRHYQSDHAPWAISRATSSSTGCSPTSGTLRTQPISAASWRRTWSGRPRR